MFAKAYDIVSRFTCPVIQSLRFFDKTVDCTLGAFIILNDEGWVVTVAHLLEPYFVFQQHSQEKTEFERQLREIEADSTLDARQKQKRESRLKSNPKWITDHSFWWGQDGVRITELKVSFECDLAIGRLEPFNPADISRYPIIKNPHKMRPGTSLCKLGFPFHQVQVSFDKSQNVFVLQPGSLPVPRFPIEGIYTRNLILGKSKDGKYDLVLLETSSPGLRGQSGGPIFDVDGTIWAIQSRTQHFPLGFSPKIVRDGREIEEHQFLNVGLGVHAALLVEFLRDNGVKFEMSD